MYCSNKIPEFLGKKHQPPTRKVIMRTNWTTAEMQEDFDVLGFAYSLCIVRRKSDNVEGTLDFYRDPELNTRIYHNFVGV